MTTIIVRVLVVVWAIISIGMGVFAFSVVHNISDGHVGIAAQEAFETIPEAIMSMMGFNGSPWIVDVAYWLTLVAALFFAFRRR
ncbi:MAG: hypothetical protein K2X34_09210 [Hyphomonadaceae bacterium]|nr:hypothetical protein [Hyphomonadaceae bacterium]